MAYVFNPFTGNLDSYGPVLTGTGTVSAAADGTAALPGIAFASDTNTGIYRSGADQLAISTNGTGRLFVNNIGNVGIGTATPGSALEINAAASTSPFIAKINTSEAARIDSSGRLLIGTSTSYSTAGAFSPLVASHGTSATSNGFGSYLWADITSPPSFTFSKSRGALGTYTIVQNGDDLGRINFAGSDGSNFIHGAWIVAEVDGTPGANDMPGRLVFSTTADGASSPTERMRITSGGNTLFSNSSFVYPATDNAVVLGGGASFRWNAVWAANGTIQTSDQRAKANIADATLGSDFIKALRPVSYKWIEGGKRDTGERDASGNYIYESVPGTRTHWGFIAQEVKQAVDDAGVDFGGWVLTDKDDPDSQQALRYDQFIAPLTKALQEALAEIESLKARVTALEP